MKRHLALQPFSRDHHGALILARLLQAEAPAYKGLPDEVAGKTLYARKFYEEHLVTHFREEEAAFALAKGNNAELDQLLSEALEEHVTLHSQFIALNDNETATSLDKIGKFLEKHIRKEERQLFPMMETCCDAATLQRIADVHA